AQRHWLFWQSHWKLLGVFEIDSEHEFYPLTRRLRTGLHAAIQVAIDHPPAVSPCWPSPWGHRGWALTASCPQQDVPSEGDCTEVLKQPHEVGAVDRCPQRSWRYHGSQRCPTQDFELRTYAAPAFARLRRSLGLREEDYQASLSSRGLYLQFISNSKSSADFFLTHDKRFFLKTQSRREIRFLLSNLPRYLRHLERYPHSLLVRFLGESKGTRRAARGSMAARPPRRYDIKGCRVNRWAEPAPEGSPAFVVLKDCNFEGKSIILGSQRTWLLRQLELDSRFLEELRVLDYSLLLALQPLHADERSSLTGSAELDSVESADAALEPGAHAVAQHRRLLPASRNPLHVLDGPHLRYFVGIIDLFTVYNWRKRLEHLWKSIRYPGQAFSTVCPAEYARRLCGWVETHTL
ncbi:PI5L1 protein, partial [Crypturellus undulatus]|nr:PI5L1 protein [Crypturellus undulatus]